MSFRVERLAGEPILLVTVPEDFDVKNDLPAAIKQIREILDGSEEPVYHTHDVHPFQMSFDDMMAAMRLLTQGEMAILRHPNIREVLVAADDTMIRAAAKALALVPYGGLPVRVFETLDEALAYAREQIAGQAD
jgi:hypothetical protein